MNTYEIKAENRTEKGKTIAKNLRKKGMIPCILYGGKEILHFSTDEAHLQKLIFTPHVYKVKIDTGSKQFEATIKDIQFHPVSDSILHIDFLEIIPGKPVVMDIPVKLEGFAVGVREGGKLHQGMRSLKTKALIEHMKDIFVINVDDLGLNKSIFVGDLSFDNISFIDNPKKAVASIKMTRVAKEETPAEGSATQDTPKAE
jgi:large subunit ribosomal protein L25